MSTAMDAIAMRQNVGEIYMSRSSAEFLIAVGVPLLMLLVYTV